MRGVFFEGETNGLAVVDPIDHHRYVMTTSHEVVPTPTDSEAFRMPVDTAVAVHTARLSLPTVVLAYVRNEAGEVLAHAEHFADIELPMGAYEIELSAPLKLYVRVESTVNVSTDAERTTIEFGDETEILVGARSHHSRPATTLTTPADPDEMMRAVSTFGSALKTFSPERSYPTLRGHPPAVELGDTLDLAGLEPPETGITIEIPPTYRAVFVVAPLAYYLGARVRPSETPRIRTETGFTHSLDGALGFERSVERTLKQVFFVDCLVRTDGNSPTDLHEWRALEPVLDLDFASLCDQPLAARLEATLAVNFETLEAHLPEWKLTAHVEAVPTSIETLPFLVDDLAVVRSPAAREVSVSNVPAATLDAFLRGDTTRSAAARSPTGSSYVRPATTTSLEQTWVGEGTPLGASKAIPDAYRNRLDRTLTDGDSRVTVVRNDPAMDEECGFVDTIYGGCDLPFEVAVERDLTTDELREVLTNPTDFVHYIGHIEAGGFECVDGTLDAGSLDAVGVDAFLLNACQSYEQGMRLVEAGAIGGIVTLSDVLNRDAVTMGRAFAGLLDAGFPLRAALAIARDESIVGGQYLVVGDGGFAISHAESGTPNFCTVERVGESFRVERRTYPTAERGLGSLFVPYTDGGSEHHLASGTVRTVELSAAELDRFLAAESMPVKVDGELYWGGRFDFEERYGPA